MKLLGPSTIDVTTVRGIGGEFEVQYHMVSNHPVILSVKTFISYESTDVQLAFLMERLGRVVGL